MRRPPNPAVTCSPLSGSTFAIGTTTVNRPATDAAGNTRTGSFIAGSGHHLAACRADVKRRLRGLWTADEGHLDQPWRLTAVSGALSDLVILASGIELGLDRRP